jgi:hypothetical protein
VSKPICLGNDKPSYERPDREKENEFMVMARLHALLKDKGLAKHVFGELKKRQEIPGDPYSLKGHMKLRGVPTFHPKPWITNMTESQVMAAVRRRFFSTIRTRFA